LKENIEGDVPLYLAKIYRIILSEASFGPIWKKSDHFVHHEKNWSKIIGLQSVGLHG